MESIFKGKVVLVTGGTGSIGGEIVRQVLAFKPAAVRIFSRDEYKQFILQQELKEHPNIRYFIGDVRNRERLRLAVRGSHFVFHTAALKHVPACEYNAFEAVETNVIGTQNLVSTAIEEGVEKLVSVSTDKACHPLNVMGATKLLGEKLVTSSQYHKGKSKTVMANVRFGNVLGSRGSVVPLFLDQIRRDEPLTLTDPEMTRFFLSIPSAVRLVFQCLKTCFGGEVFIFKMPVLTIGRLAEALFQVVAETNPGKQINKKVKNIGLRPGEKLYELLMNDYEIPISLESKEMYVIQSPIEIPNWMGSPPTYPDTFPIRSKNYDSRAVDPLTLEATKDLLRGSPLDFRL